MGRRRKAGRSISGWLAVDKPAGVSSAAVVNKARWAFGARRAGHAGTLDVPATGVLAIAFGEATKTVQFVTAATKTYRFTVRFGQSTETDDAEGSITGTSNSRPEDHEVRRALERFQGEILQVPPRFSAVKVAGERAYELARRGEDAVLSARPLTIERIEMLARPDRDHAEFEMVCGKGGYVRSIARDLGNDLGCLGHVLKLRRLRSGPFSEDDCIAFDRLECLVSRHGDDRELLPIEAGLVGIPEVRCTAEGARRIQNGGPGQVYGDSELSGQTVWGSLGGKVVAIGIYRAGELHPARVLKHVSDEGSNE